MLFKWHLTKYYGCISLHFYLPRSALHLSKIWSWLAWYQCSLLILYLPEYKLTVTKMTPQIKQVCQGKMYLSQSEMTPTKIKCLLRENSFAFNFIHLIKEHVSLPVSVTVSILTVTAFTFLTYAPNIPILFTAIPQLIISGPIQCIECTALLKTLQSLPVRCAAMMLWSTLSK